MPDASVHPELAARVAALEAQVSELFQLVGAVAPSPAAAVAAEVGPEVVALVRAGRRDEAIRALIVGDGVSTATAVARVDAVASSIGR